MSTGESAASKFGTGCTSANVASQLEGYTNMSGHGIPDCDYEINTCSAQDLANTGQQRNEDVMSESSLALECCISKESLQDSASKLIEEINGQRQENTRMIEDFKRTQTEAVNEVSESIESHFLATYDKYDPVVQHKIQQLFDTFDRITQLEHELDDFKAMFGNWYNDMAAV